jgi:hypothetical protein
MERTKDLKPSSDKDRFLTRIKRDLADSARIVLTRVAREVSSVAVAPSRTRPAPEAVRGF